MNRIYKVYVDNKLIGITQFEKADPSMGVVFGPISFAEEISNPYIFLKAYCLKCEILFDESPEIELIHTRTIHSLRVFNDRGEEIKGFLGNQISGMNSDAFEITLEGIAYPDFEKEFPQHISE